MISLEQALQKIEDGAPAPVYLVSGEEFLVRRAAEAIVDRLVARENRDLNLAVVDGAAGAREIAAHLDTLPMFRGRKVVLVEGAEFLSKRKDKAAGLARARELWAAGRQRDAARRLVVLAQAGQVAPGSDGEAWIRDALAFAEENGITAPSEESEVLLRSLENGPPAENHLVLTCALFDPSHPVAKLCAKKGVVLLREVERKGRGSEGLDYSALVREVLGPLGKKLSRDAENALKARVGDQMRLAASELQKLADYAGERKVIEGADVELLVAPASEEEGFELQNALGDRDFGRLLNVLGDDFARGKPYLVVLASVAAAVRKLLVDAARCAKVPAAQGPRELGFDEFQKSVLPAVQKQAEEAGDRAGNPYGTYMSYKRARRFGVPALVKGLRACADADLLLKSGSDGRLVLESLARALAQGRAQPHTPATP